MFELDKEYHLKAKGIIPEKYLKMPNYKIWLEDIVAAYQDLSRFYEESISDDGKLIGMEKNTIHLKLESIFLNILALRQSCSKDKTLFQIQLKSKRAIYFSFTSQAFWNLSGSVSPSMLNEITGFGLWFNEILSPMLKSLISHLGQALGDGILDTDEIPNITIAADDLLVQIIMIYLKLKRTGIVT